MSKVVADYIIQEEEAYKTSQVPLTDMWSWNMFDHIKKSFLYKHSKFNKGKNDGNRPFKNIILAILRVNYRSEGFDVKDIVPFVNDEKNYYKSFLVKKYHPKWARFNNIDTFIDEMVESFVDYGLALVKNVDMVRPEVVPLQRIAFCDQTDILSGPICEIHNYTPDELIAMKGKWDADKIDEALVHMTASKPLVEGQPNKTPGKYSKIYELHCTQPETWLNEKDAAEYKEGETMEYGDEQNYVPQLHLYTFYENTDGTKQGICLYSGKEKGGVAKRYKALKRDAIFGRACGFGGIEELFDPQKWVNYSKIQLKEMLDKASLIIFKTTDGAFAEKNGNIDDMEKGQVLDIASNETFEQVPIVPYNKEKFDADVEEWEQNARTLGAADEALLGQSPSSGTPFKLQDLVVQEGKDLHNYRRGQIAIFMGEIYRDWSLKSLVAEMNKGQTFLDELSLEEVQEIAEKVVQNQVNDQIKKGMLEGRLLAPDAVELLKQTKREAFMKGGKKRFLKIFQGELDDLPVDVEMNIAAKQKDLEGIANKLTNIFRAIIANPEILQAPGMGKLFNEIIESAGLSPVDFLGFTKAPTSQVKPTAAAKPSDAPSPVDPEAELAKT